MTLLATHRARIAASASLFIAAFLCLLFVRQTTRAKAATQADPHRQQVTEPASGPNATPVIVELFTSEGCSSCPPADALLASLDRDQPVPSANIIVLGEHVDYWDSLGWHDRFSSPRFTERQRDYQAYFRTDDIYTPQTVVNGSAQFLGSDRTGIGKAIANAAVSKVFPLQVSNVKTHLDQVTFTLASGPAMPDSVNVYVALVDPTDTTQVRSGENGGRTLHHAGVVRAFGIVGSSYHLASLGKGPFIFQANLPGVPETLDGMRLVVFAQVKHIGPILAAASCTLGPENRAANAPAQSPPPANRCAPPA